jgi:hypothetical protein
MYGAGDDRLRPLIVHSCLWMGRGGWGLQKPLWPHEGQQQPTNPNQNIFPAHTGLKTAWDGKRMRATAVPGQNRTSRAVAGLLRPGKAIETFLASWGPA